MTGKEPTNTLKRREEEQRKQAIKNKWTIGKLWEDFKQERSQLTSLKKDDDRFKRHLSPLFENKMPSDITVLEVRALRKRLEKTLQPQSVKHVLALLGRIVNHGVHLRYCTGLTFTIDLPEIDNEKTEDLTPEQFKNLWKAIEEEENIQGKNFVKMVLFTGMRRGELFKLQWKDIDFERGFIFIRSPKGGKSQKIPLSDSARQLLLTHERPYPQSPYVFPGKYGNQRVEIKRPVSRIRDRAELPKDFRPLHGLRHVYASMLASSGKVDLYVLQKLLTHKSPQMTQRYAHLRDKALKEASQVAIDVIQETLNESQKIVNIR